MPRQELYGPYIYFATTVTKDRRQIFREQRKATVLGNIIGNACAIKNFICIAYCIMPDHLHLLVKSENNAEGGLENPPSGVNTPPEPMFSNMRSDVHSGTNTKNISMLLKSIKGNFAWIYGPGHTWQPRSYVRIIDDEQRLSNTLAYIEYNFQKHLLPPYFGQPPHTVINQSALNLLG